MNDTKVHPMAEAKVRVRTMGSLEWRDSLDFDPVMLSVESGWLADAFSPVVIGLVDSVITADTYVCAPAVQTTLEYNVVWSDSGETVKAVCPVCDRVFPIAEGAPGDEWNEGYNAVFCGCDPRNGDTGCIPGV